jgi:pimeloyl-ACP methyl ester carboxylesterase
MAVSRSVEPPAPNTYGPVGRSAWLDIDWPAHQRFVRVDGRAVNVVELGAGPPVLFVHGLGGCWQNWLENLPDLARDHRVIAVDLPGFGASEMPAQPVSLSLYARTLDAVCAELDVDAAAVVGNSMGGFAAAELAIAYPQRVERLVLVSAAGLHIADLHLDRVLAGLAMTRVDLVAGVYGRWVAAHAEAVAKRSRLRRLIFAGIARHPEAVPWPLVAEQAQGFGRPAFLPALRAMTNYPLRDRLTEIACPTLVVWGANDRLVPVRDADAFTELICDARKVVYADTGHVPMLEQPARFNADLRAFLEEPPAGT